MVDMDPFILYDKYHGCWFPDLSVNQDISSHDISSPDINIIIIQEYSGFSNYKFKYIFIDT